MRVFSVVVLGSAMCMQAFATRETFPPILNLAQKELHGKARLHKTALSAEPNNKEEEEEEEDEALTAAYNALKNQKGDSVILPTTTAKHQDPVGANLTDRFIMSARALRGEFDPEDPTTDTDTDENSGLLTALVDEFPTSYEFTTVAKVRSDEDACRELVESLVKVISHQCNGAFVNAKVVPRTAGFSSIKLTSTVQSAEMIKNVYDALRADDRLKMVY
jgi:putative lipoic acid-binding regulatory protein